VLGLVAVVACAKAQHGSVDGSANDARPVADASQPDANTCATQPCDIPTQCGCSAVQACDIDVSDLMGTACRPIDATGHETDSCVGITSCDRGYVCLGGGGNSACKKYCESSADCAAPRGQCVIDITDGTNPIAGLPSVCSSNCDPTNTAAGGCPTGWKCSMYTQTHQAVDYNIADCTIAGAGAQGANCKVGANGDDSLCAANFLCTTINAGANFNCRRMCNRTAGGPQCTGGQTCLGFNPAFNLAGTEYGVCN